MAEQVKAIVVMGVSGSGKTTIGELLAGRLGWDFVDGDDLHPPANVAKMRAGTPLTDADRWPWLDAIAGWIDTARAGRPGVVTCSALKRVYRDRLLGGRPEVRLVYLHGSFEMIAARQAARRGHFMPASLIESQFATLEPPGADERAISVAVDLAPEVIVGAVLAAM
jgi:carbohydrate kinase (thermoresistant glucokinase family)